jgi:UDP-N-acetylglucosamine--N-acetylmuramyl-(pentapeptide) pyrophosphoryl-undecaprenol N-acetylglucosamine transferase
MRVLFCGGGTAGHVMPAIAMAEILLREKADCEVAFIGRKGGNENRSITKEGYKLYTINISGIKRSFTLKNIVSLIRVIKSGRIAKSIISEFSPDLVIGTGGYVCYPVVRAAIRMGIPTMMHESNVYPGLVTRILGKKCDALLLNSEGTKKHLKSTKNTIVIGNPIRTNFSSINRDDSRRSLGIGKNEFFILSFGGSLGSDVLNMRIVELMNEYSIKRPDVVHIHASGLSRYKEIKDSSPQLCCANRKCRIVPYIDDMPKYLSAADLVICRSGAMTLSELEAVGVAAILIPSPNVAENHQYENAKYVADRGGGVLIEEKNLSRNSLMYAVENLKSSPAKRRRMQQILRDLSRNDTAKLLLQAVNNTL